jgi:hypothetical protein
LNAYRRGPDKLPHGEFLAMTKADLGFTPESGPRIAQMLMVIARHPWLSNAKNFSYLPASYTTLYALAKAFPGPQLQDFFHQGLIHRGLKGDDVDELEDRLIETGQDASLYYLFARLSPLLYYADNWPDLQEVVDRLWVLFQNYAIKHKNPNRLTAALSTIGMVLVAATAANIEAPPPVATITLTLRLTRSAASAGNRSSRFSAKRYSIATLRPSTWPASPKPRRNAAGRLGRSFCPRLFRKPTTGIAGCCARAASGHAAAAPPSSMMNSRRFTRSPRRRGQAAAVAQ